MNTRDWARALWAEVDREENMWAIDGEAMIATLLAEGDIHAWLNYTDYAGPHDEGGEG